MESTTGGVLNAGANSGDMALASASKGFSFAEDNAAIAIS